MTSHRNSTVRTPEVSWQSFVVDLARVHGWLVHVERPARTANGWRTPISGHAGWPDVVLCHPARRMFLVVELKSEVGRLSPEQEAWLHALTVAGVDARVWRPQDRREVMDVLAGDR